MGESVADDDIGCLMNVIIPRNLVEYGLCQRNLGGFTFDDQKRLALPVEDYNVGAFLGLVQEEPTLRPDQRFWVGVVREEQIDNMLTHPFFGR